MGVGRGMAEEDLDELAALADSAGAEPVARIVQSRSEPDPATYVGKGKLERAPRRDPREPRRRGDLGPRALARAAPLARGAAGREGDRPHRADPGHLRAARAQSREGKAQVELAQLNYLLPRLRGWGEAMSRLGGGIGTRGPGETKMEVDRQHIRRRISKLRRDIHDLGRTRDVKRARRRNAQVTQIAIAGLHERRASPR